MPAYIENILKNACMSCTVNRKESRLSRLSALKPANLSLSIYMSLRPRVGLTLWVTAELHTECVSARCYCWQTGHTGGAGGGCGHAILSSDSGQTWHRPLMGRGGSCLERQLVCMSMFMEYAFILAHKSWARSPASISRASTYIGGQYGFFFDHVQSVKTMWKYTSSMLHFWKKLTFTFEILKISFYKGKLEIGDTISIEGNL